MTQSRKSGYGKDQCDCCGERIQDESYHQINGERICDRCLDGMIVFVED